MCIGRDELESEYHAHLDYLMELQAEHYDPAWDEDAWGEGSNSGELVEEDIPF
jgi:hypothetical protein